MTDDLIQKAQDRVMRVAEDFFGPQADAWMDDRNWSFQPTPRVWMTDRSRVLTVTAFIEKLISRREKTERRAARRALGIHTTTELEIMELEEDMQEQWGENGFCI